jgi:hypothetical protein
MAEPTDSKFPICTGAFASSADQSRAVRVGSIRSFLAAEFPSTLGSPGDKVMSRPDVSEHTLGLWLLHFKRRLIKELIMGAPVVSFNQLLRRLP